MANILFWEETSEGHMSESLPLFSHCLAPAEAPLAVPSLLSGVNKTSTHYWAAFQLSNTALLPRLQPPESAENAFMHAPSRPSAERVGFWGFLLNGIFFKGFCQIPADSVGMAATRTHSSTCSVWPSLWRTGKSTAGDTFDLQMNDTKEDTQTQVCLFPAGGDLQLKRCAEPAKIS